MFISGTHRQASAGINPNLGFTITLATAANIDANVTSARSGWPAYVDIKKDRSVAGGNWQWQFSHDSAQEYSCAASSVTRQAKSTNAGTDNFLGYSIRIDSAYGTAAGSVSHTSGADTTVTHNVGVSARQVILLFPRAGGTAVRMYHPDLTAGSTLNLLDTNPAAASAYIKSVTASSFKIDGTLVATGTYDYLVLSEIAGFFKPSVYTANNSASGPLVVFGGKPRLFMQTNATNGSGKSVFDTARFPVNTGATPPNMAFNHPTGENWSNLFTLSFDPTGVTLLSVIAFEQNYSSNTYPVFAFF